MAYYFAYRSNMDYDQMIERCPNAKYYGIGFLQDYKLGFTRNSKKWDGPVADILVSPGETVWGVIYTISEEDLTSLDKHEGHPAIYKRKRENIMIYKGPIVEINDDADNIVESIINSKNNLNHYESLQAEVYEVVNKELNLFPKLNYLNKLQDAAFEYSFPKEYQKSLYQFGLNDYNERLEKSLDAILDYQTLLESGNFPDKVKKQEEWGGADLVITGKKSRMEHLKRNHPDDVVVLTPHWRELSWLIHTLYGDDKIAWQVDATNKYFVLNELGNAALEYQIEHPNDDNPKGICLAVLYAAYKVFTSDFYKMY